MWIISHQASNNAKASPRSGQVAPFPRARFLKNVKVAQKSILILDGSQLSDNKHIALTFCIYNFRVP